MKKTESHPARDLGFLSRLHDGELSLAERSEFDLHRRGCPECSAAADEYEAVLALYRTAEPPAADAALAARITRKIDRELRRPEAARFIPARIDIVWASVVIVALAGAIATYSLVRPRTAERETLVAEKKIPVVTYAPQAPPAGNQPAKPELQARSGVPERRASAGRARPAPPPPAPEAASAAPPGAPAEEGRLDAELSRKAENAPPPAAAMAAPRAMAKEKDQAAAGVRSRDELKENAEEPIRVGPGVTPPELVTRVEPVLPDSVRGRFVQGTPVILEAIISTQGDVKNIRVVRSNPPFDQAVIGAVRQWKYKPALKDGKPVAVYLTVTVNIDVK